MKLSILLDTIMTNDFKQPRTPCYNKVGFLTVKNIKSPERCIAPEFFCQIFKRHLRDVTGCVII